MPATFSDGRLTLKQSADPAAGAEITFVADEDIIVHSVYVTLVTSATVANRRVHLIADDGANGANNIFWRQPATVDITASLTEPITAFEGATSTAAAGVLVLTLPVGGLRMRRNDRLRTLTTGIDVGDNYGAMNLWVERQPTITGS